MIQLKPDDSGAVPLYEGYCLVRAQVRDREAQAHYHPPKGGLVFSKEVQEADQRTRDNRGVELEVRHLKEEFEECEMLAYLRCDEFRRVKFETVATMLKHLEHCYVGKRWAMDDPPLLASVHREEARIRADLKKMERIKLADYHPSCRTTDMKAAWACIGQA